METTRELLVEVKHAGRKSISPDGVKYVYGRKPFVEFNDDIGNCWRIYFDLPEGVTEVPKQLTVTICGTQHQLHLKRNSINTPIPILARWIVNTEALTHQKE